MKPQHTFYGEVLVGNHKYGADKLFFDNEIYFVQAVKELEGKKFELELREMKSQRSDRQNRYYWKIIIPIFGDYFGMDKEETHEALKFEHLKQVIRDKKGVPHITVKSTAKLSTSEFEDYMSKLRRWGASEFGLNIPEPGENISRENHA